ncbi:alkaline phosphatase family protein [Thiotrichales bacterium 19S11-10]|nr:alkaline phosphatase family protein [Thiotrichales bacterium 19S11-10]
MKLSSRLLILGCALGILAPIKAISQVSHTKDSQKDQRVIIFVWDGLRPDSITKKDTPNLYKLAQQGVWFSDNHSSYPTFTMMNGSTFATGDFAGKTGFYGNTLWQPSAKGENAVGRRVDFQQPVFTEDYQVLKDLNKDLPLVEVDTLFELAHKAGIKTVTVGKSGPAFFQDYQQQGVIFDENYVYPEMVAERLNDENYPLPKNLIYGYQNFILANNINPTEKKKVLRLMDDVTSDPQAAQVSPYDQMNRYLMETYLSKLLSNVAPRLSVIWLRNPDTTEHNYGVGSTAYYDALAKQDQLLGQLVNKLKQKNIWNKTNLIIVSDHSHSNVSGPLDEFPLREINNRKVGDVDAINGFSVSGDFRPAELLSRVGFNAFDGDGCQYDPVLSGITYNGKQVYPTRVDQTGDICGKAQKYTTKAYFVPKVLPKDAIIVAANGGSTYFYVPSHNQALIEKLTRFLQSREEFGAIFISDRYGKVSGTLPLSLVKLENDNGRSPSIIAGSSYDDQAKIKGFRGTEFNGSGSSRGMHGSFSRTDVHNTLLAVGPSFKEHMTNTLPSGNVDVAPTVAHILGFEMRNTDGRVLYESLRVGGNDVTSPKEVTYQSYYPEREAIGLSFYKASDPDNKKPIPGLSNYTIQLDTKELSQGGKTYVYFDQAKAVRY